ncbi:hypothetical protein FI667_g8813, partial [Globisporangium splendens]
MSRGDYSTRWLLPTVSIVLTTAARASRALQGVIAQKEGVGRKQQQCRWSLRLLLSFSPITVRRKEVNESNCQSRANYHKDISAHAHREQRTDGEMTPAPFDAASLSAAARSDNALNPQELEDLWQAIERSTSDHDDEEQDDDDAADWNEFREPGATADVKLSSTQGFEASPRSPLTAVMTELSQQHETKQSNDNNIGVLKKKRKPRTFTSAQIDMRRKRNRDSMRRVRQRRQVEVAALHKKMGLLQDKLNELQMIQSEHATGSVASSNSSSSTTLVRTSRQFSISQADLKTLLEEIKVLQQEQVGLHNAVLEREEFSATMTQLLRETRTLNPHREGDLFTGDVCRQEHDDEFKWVNDVLPLLPPLSRANTYALVRESYLDIVTHFTAADSCRESEHTVLGWSDKRAVDGSWAHILFSKDFFHDNMETLVAKTWAGVTFASKGEDFHAAKLHLKVLERLNDDTLVIARNSYFPTENRYYSSIYVLLRVQTSTGYVIGGRTICPLPENEHRMATCLGPNRAYTHVFCALSFSRLAPAYDNEYMAVKSESGEFGSSFERAQGCRVKYGGRIGNGTALFTQTWAMDVLLAVLRWENSCVAPLYRLTSTVAPPVVLKV